MSEKDDPSQAVDAKTDVEVSGFNVAAIEYVGEVVTFDSQSVYQHVDGEIVRHRREVFAEYEAQDATLAVGARVGVIYGRDGGDVIPL